jgi:tetratricopeptide (TPR) repeat protein
LLLAAGLLASPSAAHADLAQGLDSYLHGDYKAAKRSLEDSKGAERGKAQLVLARLRQQTGDYAGAEKTARALFKSKDKPLTLEAKILVAELMRQTGRYAGAQKMMLAQYKAEPKHLATRHALALAHHDLGKNAEAETLWNLFFDDYANKVIDTNNAEHMFFVAEAAQYLNSFKDSSDSYVDSVNIDKTYHRANIEVGRLFLRKYTPPAAEESFQEVLKINPNHPDALAGMAGANITGSSYDVEAAQGFIKKALEHNPNHVSALNIRAGLEIDRNEWDKARKTIHKALQTNPESFEARALLATVFWLLDDRKAYEREKARVLGINPGFSQFFHIVMRSAEREHRYAQAVELGKEAIQIDPNDYEAMQLTGSGYLRLGKEKEGIAWMRKAWKGDEYNARTLNTLDLFEKFIPRLYEFTQSKNFKIRYHKDERKVYERYITPMLEVAFEDMVKRYGFKPKTPLILELYESSEHYSVRTIGLPNLGALGVCFGQVITAMSPSVGNINWAMVLWHELSHVFAIQLSNSRVPRWFTEGLSEYETIRARPEWRRENDSDLWSALQDGTLPSVSELNHAFMRPSMQEVVVAYHLSSVTIEYLVSRYGFGKIVDALKLFGKGKETPEVIEKITGKSVAAFDKEFRQHLRRRLAPYKDSLHLPNVGMRDLAALNKAATKAPKDADAQARLALGHFYNGDAEKAAKSAAAALKLEAHNGIALYISAELAMKGRKVKEARAFYETLAKTGNDSFDIRVRLSMLAGHEKDEKAFVSHLETAKTLDPERSYPYETLAEFYEGKGKKDLALRELETYVMIEQMALGPLQRLVDEFTKLKKWHKVVHYGQLGVNIDPAQGRLQLALARAYLESKAYDKALFAYDTALLIRPRLRRPALAHIGRAKALQAQGKKRDALKALTFAIDLEPENAEALKMRSALKP